MFGDTKGLAPFLSRGLGKGAPVGNSLFSLYGVKIVGDGFNQTETGAQTEPCSRVSASKGSPNFNAGQMKDMVAEVKALGLPVLIHCNGDYRPTLRSMRSRRPTPARPTMASVAWSMRQWRGPIRILRMKKPTCSYLMNHLALLCRAHLSRPDLLEPERAAALDPAGACVRAGLPFTLHTDGPCSPPGALALVSTGGYAPLYDRGFHCRR